MYKIHPFHKISQDHIELFFANIRSHGGSNDNPTPRLFESIYKKVIIHTELMETKTGNCMPLEAIGILNCSSAVKRINMTVDSKDRENVISEKETPEELESALKSVCLSQFAESAIEYIAGFVSSALIQHIKCKTCIKHLFH